MAGAFLNALRYAKEVHAAIRSGTILGAFFLTTLVFLCIVVLGPGISSDSLYPSYTLVEQIHVTDFLDRVEIIMFSIWLPAFLIKVAFSFIAFMVGIASFTKHQEHNIFAKQVGWFLLLGALTGFKGVTEVFAFGNYGQPILMIAYQVPVLLILTLLGIKRGKKETARQADKEFEKAEKQFAKNSKGFWARMNQVKLSTWMNFTHGLIVVAIAGLVFGVYFGPENKWFGFAAAFTYSFCLLVLVFTTQMELHKTNLLMQILDKQKKDDESSKHNKKSAS
jgi:hypothetical protein